MSFKNIKFSDREIEEYLFWFNAEGKDICSNCEIKKKIISCNKCGDAICNNPCCSKLFPHYGNTLFAICNSCDLKIGGKFKEVKAEKKMVDKMVMVNMIDHDKLRLLKKKIKKKYQTKNKNLH